VAHDALEERVGERREAHGGAGVAVAHLLHGIGGEHTNRVDGPAVQIGPVLRDARAGESLDVGVGHSSSLGFGWDVQAVRLDAPAGC
jgi:hypothetical protein